MSSEDEDIDETTLSVTKSDGFLDAAKSNTKYDKMYEEFQRWNKRKGARPVTENVLIKYFTELDKKSKPTTMNLYHAMLKSKLRLNDNLDITTYSTLNAYLKEKIASYKPIKAPVFTEEEIEKFINIAPDDEWLAVKVVCIFGINGLHSSGKICNVMIEHVKVYEDLILVTIPKIGRSLQRSFTITGTFFNIVNKYIRLRPAYATVGSFFLNYRNKTCSSFPIGRPLFEMPRRVAKFLKLPKPELYTIYSFRVIRTTNIDFGNHTTASESSNNVPDQQDQFTLDYETGLLRTSSYINYSNTSASPACNNINENRNGQHIRDHMIGNELLHETGHVCTLNCGLVQCATIENEEGALHAFSIFKPSDFKIIEVTPALYASHPICRWIVAYTHHSNEPVSSYNAEEIFDDITRSIPNNVQVMEKYIRSKSSQLLAAYVVVYGVNCRCEKQSSEIFNFEMKNGKIEL